MKIQTFEDWLEEKYINSLEDGGVPITKDNVESMFENWLERLDTQEVIDLADTFAKIMYIQGSLDELNKK